MHDFWINAAQTVWSIIFTVIGWALLLIIVGFITHEIFVVLTRLVNNRNEDKEDS